jgi:hypothetical protein
LLYNAVSGHEGEDAPFVLVEAGGFGLSEEGSQVLWLERQELVRFGVEVDLKFLDLGQVDLVVVYVDFGHHLAVVVTNLCVNLSIFSFTCGFWSLKNSVKTLYLAKTFFWTIWILVLGFFSSAIWSSRNSLNLTEARAFSFSNSGCNSLTALESGAIELWFR